MSISNDLVKQFVQITKDNSPVKTESTVYGTAVEYNGQMYVQIDGSDLITPVETTTELKSGERVTVMIKDHNATVTGNLTNPAAGKNTVANIQGNLDDIGSQITEFEIVIADKVSTKDFEANNAAINNLLVGKADINELNAVSASVRDLEAENANIQTLISNKANIADLTAANAKIDDLYANKANVGDLEAATADINDLNADVAKISTLIGGDANIDNVQSIILTSDNTTIDNALIKNAMIDTISADKITSGTVNTNKVNIVSEDGGIVIAGSTQQFKDETGTVRVQIGKDAQGNFTFCLFSQNGTGVLLDETGIKAGAVPDGLIVNDMVADNANISGTKLDISSVITQINGNSTSINSSVIKFDDTGQSLLVAFNSLKETVSSIEELTIDGDLAGVMEQVKTNTTKLEVVQGSIETLVTNTTITKENGEVVQLKDDYAVTKQTVGEITNKIGTLETNYKKTLKSSSVQYYLSTSLTSLSGGSWQDTAPEWTQGKYMWQRMKYTYTDNSVTYGTASCVAGAKGDTGEQGPQGSKGDTGDSGVGVSKITNYYLAINSASGVTNTMTGWTTTIQNVSKDKKYLWNYEKVDYTNNTSTKTDPCIIGTYGDTGATGKGIQLITEYYATSTTKESLPTSWSTTVPTLTATNKYLWNYEKITYTDNSNVDTPKVIIGVYGDKGDTGAQGPKGDKGDIGPQGVQGPAGKNGTTTYTWIKYADSSTGSGMSNDPTGKTYIGFAYNKTTSTESNTASDYTWSLIKGDKGDTGVQGPAGKNGKTTYTWIKYSDNADGTGLYDTPKSTTKYIGIATNKTTATESTTKTDYTWSLFKGDKGDKGSQGPKGDTGSKGDTGEKGQSLTSSSPQWYLSTSNTTQTGGSWKDTMPTVVSGKYMWTRFKNVWANPTATTYTTPVLEQIAESVKEVHSKQAEFKETLDGISATVSEHTSSLESVTSTVSQHTTDLTGISSKITSLEKNTSGLSKTVAQHTTDLSGVTSKISSLESSASGLNSRLQTAENKLTKDGITSIVGDYYAAGKATRDALSRIEQKADSVTTTVSNLKVGGTNLLLNTQFEGAVAGTRTLPYWLITESCIIFGNYGHSGYNKMNTMYLGNDNANSDGTKTGYMYQTLTSDRFQKNTEYTLSLELVAENNVKGWEVVIRYYDANSKLLANQVIFDNSTHSAGHLVSTFTSKNIDANMVQFCIGHKGSTNGNSGYLLIVGNIMLEKGNTPTQWQPSPQDMASKSIVTQTANEVKYQFQQAGGFPNLVANGAPKQTNDNNWWYWNATKYTGDNNYTELGFYSNNTSDNNCCIGTQWMVVSPGKTYSISFWAYCEPNVVNPHVVAKCGDSNYENLQYPKLCNLKLGNANDKKWYKYKINWTAPSGITRMQLCFHQENHTQNVNYVTRIDQVMVIEGRDIFPTKWYPRFEEVESNTTSIDVNGVNVRHSSGARTNLNSTALNFYNSSGILYAQVDGGKYHFWNDSTYVGFLGHTSWANTQERVLTINADYNQTVALTGKVNSSDTVYQVWVVASPSDKTISGSVFHQGVTLIKPHTGGIFKFYGSSAHTDTYPGMIYATTEGYLCVKGDNHVELAIQVGNNGYNGLVITEIGENPYKKLDIWGRLDMHWWEIYNTNIVNNVSATSAQTYALRTSSTNEETYSDPTRKTITDIFSVQSPTEGDIRWSDRQTYFTSEVETGVYECYVEIPWWIAQNLENDYHVNITCTNGFYQYYVSERDPYYFIVRSDKDSMGFTFELCGKLLDNNTTANNGSVAGDQYLGHEIREDEEVPIVKDDGGSILENNTDTVINN